MITHLDVTLDNHVELASVLGYTGPCHHNTESSSASGGAPSCHDTEGEINVIHTCHISVCGGGSTVTWVKWKGSVLIPCENSWEIFTVTPYVATRSRDKKRWVITFTIIFLSCIIVAWLYGTRYWDFTKLVHIRRVFFISMDQYRRV